MTDNMEFELQGIALGLSSLQSDIVQMTSVLEQISDGLFYLNLHIGAAVTPWVPDRATAAAPTASMAATPAPNHHVVSDVVPGRAHGRVTWFNASQGVGFITPDGGGEDVFVHQSGLLYGSTSLDPDQRVEFDIVPGPKGPMAKDVRIGS